MAQVDRALQVAPTRAYRWYDDYEIACSSRQEAEAILVRLNRLLDSFRLRLNPKKTQIIELPQSAGEGWQDELRTLSKNAFASPANMVAYFDHAFRLRTTFAEQPVLMYAIGSLFKVRPPAPDVRRVAESCTTQAILSEPGCAQKAFALLTFWELNGAKFDHSVLTETVDRLIQLHESRGVSSDVAWAMAFCIQHGLPLSRRSGRNLSRLEDDAVAIQALHAHSLGLTPGFSPKSMMQELAVASCEGEHWLLLYEAVRHGFIPKLKSLVVGNPLFSDLLAKGVTFYRLNLPAYAPLVHPGGAPEWVVGEWVHAATAETKPEALAGQPVAQMIDRDVALLDVRGKAQSDVLRDLVGRLTGHSISGLERYE